MDYQYHQVAIEQWVEGPDISVSGVMYECPDYFHGIVFVEEYSLSWRGSSEIIMPVVSMAATESVSWATLEEYSVTVEV